MGFLDHLEELRWRLAKSLFAIILGSIISFSNIDVILNILLSPTKTTTNPIKLQVLSVQGMFLIKWFISFISGFVLSLPYLIYQTWKFIAPGLLVNEKKFVFPIVFFGFTSFIGGVLFGYFVIIPFSLEFFSGIGNPDVQNNFSIQYYFSFLTWLLLGAGTIFHQPRLDAYAFHKMLLPLAVSCAQQIRCLLQPPESTSGQTLVKRSGMRGLVALL